MTAAPAQLRRIGARSQRQFARILRHKVDVKSSGERSSGIPRHPLRQGICASAAATAFGIDVDAHGAAGPEHRARRCLIYRNLAVVENRLPASDPALEPAQAKARLARVGLPARTPAGSSNKLTWSARACAPARHDPESLRHATGPSRSLDLSTQFSSGHGSAWCARTATPIGAGPAEHLRRVPALLRRGR